MTQMTKYTFDLTIYSAYEVDLEIPVHAESVEKAIEIIEGIGKSTRYKFSYDLVIIEEIGKNTWYKFGYESV